MRKDRRWMENGKRDDRLGSWVADDAEIEKTFLNCRRNRHAPTKPFHEKSLNGERCSVVLDTHESLTNPRRRLEDLRRERTDAFDCYLA